MHRVLTVVLVLAVPAVVAGGGWLMLADRGSGFERTSVAVESANSLPSIVGNSGHPRKRAERRSAGADGSDNGSDDVGGDGIAAPPELGRSAMRIRSRRGDRQSDGAVVPSRDAATVTGDGLNGAYSEVDRRGRVICQGVLDQGKRTGDWVENLADGGRRETQYLNDCQHGVEVLYAPDGKPRLSCAYKHNRPHGTWTTWQVTGEIHSTREFLDGELHGFARSFHLNGRVAEEATYSRGLTVGATVGWYDDGAVAYEIPFGDGERSGIARWYHRNGRLAACGTYVHNEFDGEYVTWNAQGAEESVEYWEAGVKVFGPETRDAFALRGPTTSAVPETDGEK